MNVRVGGNVESIANGKWNIRYGGIKNVTKNNLL